MEIKSLVALVVLFSVFKSGRALHCYTCNVSTSTLDENGCSGIGSLKGCAGGSVCLAATYEINSGIVKTYTTMQSCFPDMAGTECDNFFKTQKNLHTSVALARNSCYVCNSDNCNKKPRPMVGNGGMVYSKTSVVNVVLVVSIMLFKLINNI
ncbi:uncharacterized protein LOC126744324 isoform X1 [Anthonomus grandis grandis]|uniref:uncharacterized protein LOC126744324 isoform X1 n=1 Tax=Anthonomus grandis grandis TaxID=2921223 RepID=UPI00216633BD|nr:uncharacterized protein LOC126744324 isoform X1 [Anthonomus grandis grandis]